MTNQDYSCRTVRHMLPLHAGGDLDPRHVDAVDGHLKTCLPCFREFREYASMRSRLGVLAEERLPEGALEGFAEEVMARIAVGEPGPAAAAPGGAVIRWPLLPRLAAAAAVLIVCVAGWRYSADGALQPNDRPPTANPLPPENTVGGTQGLNRQGPQLSVSGGAVTAPRNGAVSRASEMPALQGLHLPSEQEMAVMQQAADAGMILLIQPGENEGLDAEGDDATAEPPFPRKRLR